MVKKRRRYIFIENDDKPGRFVLQCCLYTLNHMENIRRLILRHFVGNSCPQRSVYKSTKQKNAERRGRRSLQEQVCFDISIKGRFSAKLAELRAVPGGKIMTIRVVI